MALVVTIVAIVVGIAAAAFGIWMGMGWSPSRKERARHAGEEPATAALWERQTGWIRGSSSGTASGPLDRDRGAG